jgi:hypothetical protein
MITIAEKQAEMRQRDSELCSLRARVTHLEKQVEAYRNLLIGDVHELDPVEGDPFRPKRKYTLKPGSRPPGRPRKSEGSQTIPLGSIPLETRNVVCQCGGAHKHLPPDPILERAFARLRLTQQVK